MQQIIQHLFRVNSLEEVPRERLEELVSTYPSFSMGRYLLSRKLRTEDAGHFSEETQKTNLYFTNPFWLHWLLQNEAGEQQPAYARSAPATANVAAEERMVEEEQSWGMPDISGETGVGEETDTVPAEPVTGEYPLGIEGGGSEKPAIVDEPGVTAELAAAPLTAAESLLQSLEEARGLRQALVQMNEIGEESPVQGVSEEPAVESALEDIQVESRFEEAPGGVVSIAESRAEEAGMEGSSARTDLTGQQHGEEKHELNGMETPESAAMVPESATVPESLVAAVVAQAAAQTTAHTESGEPIVEFEPYHTIDYFASVGIKLVQDENPSDKLGKQLKSFTEWLKVMRKLPQKNQEIVPDGAVEHQIQAIAAHSITGKEVLTETMAEVLVKQGMREKAMDVYHKLSLLNPDKSAYFASKIEQLKID
jgi:hypothetical protein